MSHGRSIPEADSAVTRSRRRWPELVAVVVIAIVLFGAVLSYLLDDRRYVVEGPNGERIECWEGMFYHLTSPCLGPGGTIEDAP